MARYAEWNKFIANLNTDKYGETNVNEVGIAFEKATADVVPKSEVEKLELTLQGVMWSVDKWLDETDYDADPIKRAITMREKTLKIVENVKAEVACELVGLYEKCASKIPHHIRRIFKDDRNFEDGFREGKTDALIEVLALIAELKKKYTEGE